MRQESDQHFGIAEVAETASAPDPVSTPQLMQFMGLREQLKAVMDRDDARVAQADIARECGFSTATVSTFLAGKYKGDNAAIAEKLQRWLDAYRTRHTIHSGMPDAPAFVDTPTTRKIMAVCTYAQMAGDMALIYGGAGVSKTTSLRQYASRHNNVWHLQMTAANGRMVPALDSIAAAVGARHWIQRANWLQDQIILKIRDTAGLLAIDEAQHLDQMALEAVRALHDATGIGVILAGNERVHGRLTGGGSRTAEFAQLFSRIGKKLHLNKPPAEDVEAIAKAWKITGKAELKLLADIAAKPGALRGMTKTLRLAAIVAGGARAINAQHITEAWMDLGGAA